MEYVIKSLAPLIYSADIGMNRLPMIVSDGEKLIGGSMYSRNEAELLSMTKGMTLTLDIKSGKTGNTFKVLDERIDHIPPNATEERTLDNIF